MYPREGGGRRKESNQTKQHKIPKATNDLSRREETEFFFFTYKRLVVYS